MRDTAVRGGESGLRCSVWAAEQAIDPIGSAGCVRGFLVVPWSLPWPADVGDLEALSGVRARLDGLGIRIQATVPEGDDSPGRLRLYRTPPDSGPRLDRYELTATSTDPGDLAEATSVLLESSDPAMHRPPATESLATSVLLESSDPAMHRPPATELLVCTHGRRDRCCGSAGTALFEELRDGSDGPLAGVTLRRTSHTGGHRFAPTAILLPDATLWARLTAEVVARIVTRVGSIDEVLPHYRGCATLATPRVQALERAVLAEVGWSLFDAPRWGDEADGRTRLHVRGAAGDIQTWSASVEVARWSPVPSCGQPIAASTKSEPEWRVTDLAQIA
jgi:hypothetical protein